MKPIAILSLLFFIWISPRVIAQQRPVYSQYMFEKLLLNPAYAGNQKQLSATFLYRNQWVNLEGAPKLETFAMHSALKKWPVGVGLVASHDKLGVHDDMSVYGSYSYKIKLPVGTLSMGLQGGFNYTTSDFTKLTLIDPDDPILNGVLKKFKPNFGTGVFFNTNTTYAGFSIPYLVNNAIYDKEDIIANAREARYYFLTGGHIFTLNEDLKLSPSVLFRVQEGQPAGMDVNTNLFILDLVNVGMSYRSGDAMIFLFEILLNSNFRLGYAYDHTLSKIGNYTDGTHEMMLNYRLKIGKDPCHAYF